MWIFKQIALIAQRSNLHLLYLCYALPIGIFLIVATPPFQTPDAVNHFYRATQIADGNFVAQRFDGTSGGPIDKGVITLADIFDPIAHYPEVKVSASMLAAAHAPYWTGETTLAGFPGAAVYPMFSYLPQAAAITVGRTFRMNIRQTYVLTCAVGMLFSIALTCWAIAISRRTAPFIFCTAMLPCTLMIFTSVSQEVSVLPLCFLLIAFLARHLDEGRVLTARDGWLACIALWVCIASRPPYVGFLVLLFCPGLRVSADSERYGWLRRIGWCLAAGVPAAIAAWIFGHAAWAPVPPPRSVAGQLAFLLHDPVNVLRVAVATLRTNSTFYYQSFIGNLGWLDTPLDIKYYRLAAVMLACNVAATMLYAGSSIRGRFADRAITLASIGLCLGMIFASLYLTWTPVAQLVIDGVQGRYLLPLLPPLALVLTSSNRSVTNSSLIPLGEKVALLGAALFPVCTFIEVIHILIARYYVH
ncbi:DUF2142 domain-containing protein [Paraburkholderia flava]|uniref:DUF2142 domain-containing protein n=1 Tax=Paraburkholderia flava TaxID=2547393 RepID=UPI00105F8F8D|nr:DUF2142 domain-containing protein [Paraburkholderia flava]